MNAGLILVIFFGILSTAIGLGQLFSQIYAYLQQKTNIIVLHREYFTRPAIQLMDTIRDVCVQETWVWIGRHSPSMVMVSLFTLPNAFQLHSLKLYGFKKYFLTHICKQLKMYTLDIRDKIFPYITCIIVKHVESTKWVVKIIWHAYFFSLLIYLTLISLALASWSRLLCPRPLVFPSLEDKNQTFFQPFITYFSKPLKQKKDGMCLHCKITLSMNLVTFHPKVVSQEKTKVLFVRLFWTHIPNKLLYYIGITTTTKKKLAVVIYLNLINWTTKLELLFHNFHSFCKNITSQTGSKQKWRNQKFLEAHQLK